MPSKRGFTTVELLVVVLVVVILALVALPAYRDYTKPVRVAEPLASSNQALKELHWQDLALVAPEQLELGSTGTIELALGGNKTIDELALLLRAEGARTGFRVQVSGRMEAVLTGARFEITPVTPLVQVVATEQATRWVWNVRGVSPGRSKLTLSLNALLTVDGKDSLQSVRTLEHEIHVKVTSAKGAWAFVETYWVYIAAAVTAVVIPLIGLAYRRWYPTTKP